LLKSYIKENSAEKRKGSWVVNKNADEVVEEAPVRAQFESRRSAAKFVSPTLDELKEALKTGDVDQIIQAKQKLTPTDKVSLTERSQIIGKVVKNERIDKATNSVIEMLNVSIIPLPIIDQLKPNK